MNDLTVVEDAEYVDNSIDAVSTDVNPMGAVAIAARKADQAIRVYAEAARRVMDDQNQSRMHFTVDIDGRVNGDLALVYAWSTQSYGDQSRSHNPHNAFKEMLRRHGWQEKNEAKLLSNGGHRERHVGDDG